MHSTAQTAPAISVSDRPPGPGSESSLVSGPRMAIAMIASDLSLTGRTAVADVSQLGLDRFDELGRSRIATDPIALPFPTTTTAEVVRG